LRYAGDVCCVWEWREGWWLDGGVGGQWRCCLATVAHSRPKLWRASHRKKEKRRERGKENLNFAS